ncbi:MAG: hypothetical protein SOU32_00515 [Lachnospiraceae bacterium]|nr:hypothetical protein [Lachnospiraceae bacterium]
MSDKRYRITLTGRQLALVGDAVELMMRTGMGKTYGLAEWLTLAGNNSPSGNDFNIFIAQRNLTQAVLDGIVNERRTQEKSDVVRELQTINAVIRHRQWMDDGMNKYDVRSHKPIMRGSEPVLKIERMNGERAEE